MTLEELENLVRGSGSDSLEIHNKVVRDIGSAAVVLFAIHSIPSGKRLELAGSGTLVSSGDAYWILTAAHVWDRKIKAASELGITLRKETDHCFPIDTNAIEPCHFKQQTEGEEWGPDLILLRIPSALVGTIEANKASYHWELERPSALNIDRLETFYLLGCPADLGTFSSVYAKVAINGFPVNVVAEHRRAQLDYLDVDAFVHDSLNMKSFGGVSGGGLWRVWFFVDPKSREPSWAWRLEGVAFYQFPIVDNFAIIRCHGPQSIGQVVFNCQPSLP